MTGTLPIPQLDFEDAIQSQSLRLFLSLIDVSSNRQVFVNSAFQGGARESEHTLALALTGGKDA